MYIQINIYYSKVIIFSFEIGSWSQDRKYKVKSFQFYSSFETFIASIHTKIVDTALYYISNTILEH